jgi:hypothetical protein
LKQDVVISQKNRTVIVTIRIVAKQNRIQQDIVSTDITCLDRTDAEVLPACRRVHLRCTAYDKAKPQVGCRYWLHRSVVFTDSIEM